MKKDRNLSIKASVAVGRAILAAENRLAPEAFKVWLSETCGLTRRRARIFISIALAADAHHEAAA